MTAAAWLSAWFATVLIAGMLWLVRRVDAGPGAAAVFVAALLLGFAGVMFAVNAVVRTAGAA